MSQIKKHGFDKACYKEINGFRVYLYKGRDLFNGRGWFCHAYSDDHPMLFGFSKSKFSAVKNALFSPQNKYLKKI